MKYFISGTLAIAACIVLLFAPKVDAQFPPGTCVLEISTSTVAGKLVSSTKCENRTKFTVPAFTGIPCTQPAVDIILYAKLPDGTCLEIQAVAAPGFIADRITVRPDAKLDGTFEVLHTYAKLTPVK